MSERGSIRAVEAYALGKMLDHSGWQKGEKIVRLITPSDIDACWDNDGHVIFAEFSSEHSQWGQLNRGQRLLYENVIKGGPHVAVLCRHNVRVNDGKLIHSRDDIVSFQPMIYDHEIVVAAVLEGNHWWQRFIAEWFEDPLNIRRKILGRS